MSPTPPSTALVAVEPVPHYDYHNFATARSHDLSEPESLKVWTKVWVQTADLAGFRVVVAWRLARAIMVENGELEETERLRSVPLDTIPQPTDPTTRADFCRRAASVAKRLRVAQGSEDNPNLGYWGLTGLTQPETVFEAWPRPYELLFFEDSLIEELKILVLRQSKGKTRAKVRSLMGLSQQEAGALVQLALQEAQRQDTDDVETKRFMAEGWLTDYIDRCQEEGDLNSEMKGLKMLAMVQGLTRVEPENQMDLMVQAIASVAAAATRDSSGPRLLTEEEPTDD